jgi:hypothetical protein
VPGNRTEGILRRRSAAFGLPTPHEVRVAIRTRHSGPRPFRVTHYGRCHDAFRMWVRECFHRIAPAWGHVRITRVCADFARGPSLLSPILRPERPGAFRTTTGGCLAKGVRPSTRPSTPQTRAGWARSRPSRKLSHRWAHVVLREWRNVLAPSYLLLATGPPYPVVPCRVDSDAIILQGSESQTQPPTVPEEDRARYKWARPPEFAPARSPSPLWP